MNMCSFLFKIVSAILCGAILFIQSSFANAAYREKTIHEFSLSSLALTSTHGEVTLIQEPLEQFQPPVLKLSTESDADLIHFRCDEWDNAQYLVFDMYYDADHSGMFTLRAYAKGENSPRIYAVIGLLPRLNTRVTFPLSLLNGQQIFMKRDPGRLKGVVQGNRLYVDEIDRISLGLSYTGLEKKQVAYINNIALLKDPPEFSLPDVKLVDPLGQNTQKNWPGKTSDIDSLRHNLQAALEESNDASYPKDFSIYGGTLNKRFKATGFFRVEHDGSRWWMVDPEGCGFYSLGLDCIQPGEWGTILPGMEKLFEWLPTNNTDFTPAFSQEWTGNNSVCFPIANLIRVFGTKDWKEKWITLTRGRMIEWGFNTIGNWSDIQAFRGKKIPYVLPLGAFPSTQTMLFRDFPDVFSAEFKENSVRFARELESYKDDPWLIGYFMRNEPEWGFGKFNLASEMLEANPGTATRKGLSKFIKNLYNGNLSALNKAWNTDLKSFEELITHNFRRMETRSLQAEKDLWSFSEQMVLAYVKIPAAELRKVDPNHLNMGMRYAWIASDLMYKAGEVFDIFTINCYGFLPDFKSIDTIAAKCGKPTLIGEFHFGALDRGLTATGLKAVKNQIERGKAYRRYVEMGATNPNLLGTHYFILNDQALLGRFDGENYQIGFVDVTLSPYEEIVEAAKETHRSIYDIMMGKKTPFNTPAETIRNISF